MAWCSVKVSEMNLRKISPNTRCLYSAASICARSLSALAQSTALKSSGHFALWDLVVVSMQVLQDWVALGLKRLASASKPRHQKTAWP